MQQEGRKSVSTSFYERKLRACNERLASLGNPQDPGGREAACRALVDKGFALSELGQQEAALSSYEKAVTRYAKMSNRGFERR